MGDAGGGGGTGGVTGVSTRSAERHLPRLHQPALPWRPRLLPRCGDTTVTWAQRTTDLGLGGSPDIRSLGRVCSLPAPTSGGEGTTSSDGCRGAGHPHHPPNSTGSPREQGRWLRRGNSSGCTSTSPGRVPKEHVGSCCRRAHRTKGTWAGARHQGAMRTLLHRGPDSVLRGVREEHCAEARPGRAAPRSTKGHPSRTLASVTRAAQCPAPPQLARKGATSCFVSFLFFLLLKRSGGRPYWATSVLPPLPRLLRLSPELPPR